MTILLALGSYWVNYGKFFKTDEGRKVVGIRDAGAAIRTTISFFIAIGASYGLVQLFALL